MSFISGGLLYFLIFLALDGIQYFLRVFDSPGHFILLRLEHIRKHFISLLAFFAGKHNCFLGSMQQNLAVVEEVDLEQFIAETEHNGVSGFQPLFDVDKLVISLVLDLFLGGLLNLLVEVNDEPFEEEVLFLEVPVSGHRLSLIGEDIFLFEGWVLNKVDVPG